MQEPDKTAKREFTVFVVAHVGFWIATCYKGTCIKSDFAWGHYHRRVIDDILFHCFTRNRIAQVEWLDALLRRQIAGEWKHILIEG